MQVFPGQSYPLGATVYDDGVNFSLFTRNATNVELLLFHHHEDAVPAHRISLAADEHRTFYYWHAFIQGIGPGQLYGYQVDGPYVPEMGLRYDESKLLIDPYAYGVMYGDNYQREAAKRAGNNCAHAMKCVVVNPDEYDWEGDKPLQHPFPGSVIYEMHVRGFTRHPSSGVNDHRSGTYAGLIEKIPYLQELGVTAVELMPIQQFDAQAAPMGLPNYWGYQPIAFFAPHRGYSSRQDALGPVNEFKDMVKALHRAGIEVILDVVFNHTAEDDEIGPTLSLRGLENRAYYLLYPFDRSLYLNFSGTGNTINANHSIVRRMILDSLRYWVHYMHVDGFRFDLASVLSRDESGHPIDNPPVLWEIESDPVLAGTKIIAEAWDAAGLYQVGSFIGHRWSEWNGRYRDDVRRFVKSDSDSVGRLAAAIGGSRDLYSQPGREPNRSINFITAHDGFTLNDLVSYNEKHNHANGEHNRDGHNDNLSWNCGVEGPTDDADIEALRLRQMKNCMTILMISQGTPMFMMGDEVRRTQGGNNNAYCQDNEISWFDWNDVRSNGELLHFVRRLISFRRHHHLFYAEGFWVDPGEPEITWHGVQLYQPDWGEASHTLSFELCDRIRREHMHVMLNAFWDALDFELPAPYHGTCWHRVVDTFLPAPDDFAEPPFKLPQWENGQHVYRVQARSVVVLLALNCEPE